MEPEPAEDLDQEPATPREEEGAQEQLENLATELRIALPEPEPSVEPPELLELPALHMSKRRPARKGEARQKRPTDL